MSMRGKAVIAGIGHTKLGKLPGRSTISLNVESCRKALADAGIEKGLVDAVYVKYPTSAYESKYGQTLAEALGLQPRIGGVWGRGVRLKDATFRVEWKHGAMKGSGLVGCVIRGGSMNCSSGYITFKMQGILCHAT